MLGDSGANVLKLAGQNPTGNQKDINPSTSGVSEVRSAAAEITDAHCFARCY